MLGRWREIGRNRADVEFARILGRFGLKRRSFRKLLSLPFEDAMAAVRASVTGKPAFDFMAPRELPRTGIEDRVTDPSPASAIEARRVIVDRPMQFYLMHKLHRMPPAEFDAHVEISGLDRLDAAAGEGRGVILLNSHFGPGHLVPLVLSRIRPGLTSLAPIDFRRPLKIANDEALRTVELQKTFELQALAIAQRCLAAGGILHSTGDGLRGRSMRPCEFLGSRKPFPASMPVLSCRTGAACLPVFSRTDEFGRITVEILDPLHPGSEDVPVYAQADRMIAQYSALLEARWLADFGNVPGRVLRLFAAGWDRRKLTQ